MESHSPNRKGPGLRSGFGKQVLSKKSSAPSVGFGSSGRDAALKQYLSPEHAKVQCGNNSQGPAYRVYSSVGKHATSTEVNPPVATFGSGARVDTSITQKAAVPGPGAYKLKPTVGGNQIESRSPSPSKTVFGSATRDGRAKVFVDPDMEKDFFGKDSPGPSAYTMPSPAVTSNHETSPKCGMGKGDRFKYDYVARAQAMPGAGAYKQPDGIGKQAESNHRTLPQFSFGSSTRDHTKKIFISPEHERHMGGVASPGPGTAAPRSSLGSQLLSTKKSQSGWHFGKSTRDDRDSHKNMPGPGAYYA